MPRYQFNRPVGPVLLDRLIAAGFPPETPVAMDGGLCWVTCAPEEYDRLVAVVAAYDQAALDAQAATERQADDDDRTTLRVAVQTLLDDAARLSDTTVTLTTAQLRAHLARTNRALAGTLRMLRRQGVI